MNEADLIRQVTNGNTDAFRYLVSGYRKLVLHIVGRIVRQPEDIEDVCQEVFIKVYQKIGRFRGESKFSTWIAAIAYNTSISFIKTRHKKVEVFLEDILIAEKKWLAADEFHFKDNEDINKLILRMIESLPVQYRTVLTLFHLEEFSYREIEQITGMPGGTVKSYLSRARNLLKQRIEKMQLIEKITIFHEYAEQ
jgi:RNA polymerase sigma factor (sigma-70 family)